MHIYPDDGLPDTTPRPRVTQEDLEAAAALIGVRITGKGSEIQPGDLYLAGRNTGVKLLTCDSVSPRKWINPVQPKLPSGKPDATKPFHYPYDTWECVRVEEIS